MLPEKKIKISFKSDLSELAGIRKHVSGFMGKDLDEIENGRVVLAIDEAVSNIIIHGYGGAKTGGIELEMIDMPDCYKFILSDSAAPFDPLALAEPDWDAYREGGKSSGLGVNVYKRILTVKYEKSENGGNRLIMIKEKAHGGSAE